GGALGHGDWQSLYADRTMHRPCEQQRNGDDDGAGAARPELIGRRKRGSRLCPTPVRQRRFESAANGSACRWPSVEGLALNLLYGVRRTALGVPSAGEP